ncbi:hypothetical protein [Alteraurantiacibacter buctensis]|uniref:Uncharacterized protein n=1 Tax=Alteraurantiacibacter buctensis TaxID=1503981 RepID=A0A844YTY4_9SPHN|nr:hypothetical protein [Alteraurantiacibacter buctensis]MXO70476.1 hypothetical protein [Alteraurantiacibacter buctensis]
MFSLLLLAAATPAAAEFNGTLAPYVHCLRTQSREPAAPDDSTGEFSPERWPAAIIPSFATAIRYCEPLRAPAMERAREIVRARHPDWEPDFVEQAAQRIMARIELRMITVSLELPTTSHGEIEDW